MIEEWTWPAAAAALAVVVLALAVALLRDRSRHRRDLAASRAEVASLRTQIEKIERVLTVPPKREPPPAPQYQITELGTTATQPSDPVGRSRAG